MEHLAYLIPCIIDVMKFLMMEKLVMAERGELRLRVHRSRKEDEQKTVEDPSKADRD